MKIKLLTILLLVVATFSLLQASSFKVLTTSGLQTVTTTTGTVTDLGLGKDIWIAAKPQTPTVPTAGTGTATDPFDGGSQAKFDAIMSDVTKTPTNTMIHLYPGTFQKSVTATWVIRSGCTLAGSGMYLTTVQLVGSLAGIHYDVEPLKSALTATSNITIKDLTVDGNWPVIGASADTGAGGEKWVSVGGAHIRGSNSTLERVRAINGYGSWANATEIPFLMVGATSDANAINCWIKDCRSELPWGTYCAPYSIWGWRVGSTRTVIKCGVIGGVFTGVNTGNTNGFFTGGGSDIVNARIESNYFEDCRGAFYNDIGTINGLKIINNVIVRGFSGINLVSPSATRNVEITGNTINIQNKTVNANRGVDTVAVTNLIVTNNFITYDTGGSGSLAFHSLLLQDGTNTIVKDNIVDEASAVGASVGGKVTGTGRLLVKNRKTIGGSLTADAGSTFADNEVQNSLADISPARPILADRHNFDPGSKEYFQAWQTDITRNVTGLTFTPVQVNGETHVIVNTGANPLGLPHESTLSIAANRFHNTTGTTITLTPDQEATIWYDGGISRWRVSELP